MCVSAYLCDCGNQLFWFCEFREYDEDHQYIFINREAVEAWSPKRVRIVLRGVYCFECLCRVGNIVTRYGLKNGYIAFSRAHFCWMDNEQPTFAPEESAFPSEYDEVIYISDSD